MSAPAVQFLFRIVETKIRSDIDSGRFDRFQIEFHAFTILSVERKPCTGKTLGHSAEQFFYVVLFKIDKDARRYENCAVFFSEIDGIEPVKIVQIRCDVLFTPARKNKRFTHFDDVREIHVDKTACSVVRRMPRRIQTAARTDRSA